MIYTLIVTILYLTIRGNLELYWMKQRQVIYLHLMMKAYQPSNWMPKIRN
jgi:hypothetical protein